jgi:hypothetical protein
MAALLAAGGACSSGDDDTIATPAGQLGSTVSSSPTASTVARTSAPSGSTTAVDPASDRAGAALEEVVGWLADPATADPARFAESFLQQVPIDQIRQALSEIGAGPWTAVGVEPIALEPSPPAWRDPGRRSPCSYRSTSRA